MKIGLISSAVPLVSGGARNIVDWLAIKLTEHGHQAEAVYLPATDDPDDILQQMAAFRMIRLEDHYDRVVTFRPPAHVVRHPRKVVWFIHHIRMYYDLWNSSYYPVPGTAPWRSLRRAIMRADTTTIAEAHRVFTNSRVVGERLRQYNGIDSEILYPPILQPELYHAGDYGDEIVCVSRLEVHKRQHLLVEAMAHTKSPVRLRLCGASMNSEYVRSLHKIVRRDGTDAKVDIENRWVSEEEKAQRLSGALAAAYVPFDEDSYGYSTIEAAHARRCTVTVADAGGVLEFVQDGETGYVVAPDARALAAAFDQLHHDRARARRLGAAAHERLDAMGIDWQTVVTKLLA